MFNPFKLIKRAFVSSDYSQVSNFLQKAERIITLANAIEDKKKALSEAEYKLLSENKDDVFISLRNFLEIIESSHISMEEVLKKCQHRHELSGESVALAVDAFVENNHLIFCIDKLNCLQHKDVVSSKVNLVTLRT